MWEEASILAAETNETLGLPEEVNEVIDEHVTATFGGESAALQGSIAVSIRIALITGVIIGSAQQNKDAETTVTVGITPSELREIIESMVGQGQFSIAFSTAVNEEE